MHLRSVDVTFYSCWGWGEEEKEREKGKEVWGGDRKEKLIPIPPQGYLINNLMKLYIFKVLFNHE